MGDVERLRAVVGRLEGLVGVIPPAQPVELGEETTAVLARLKAAVDALELCVGLTPTDANVASVSSIAKHAGGAAGGTSPAPAVATQVTVVEPTEPTPPPPAAQSGGCCTIV
jgi:hypothetical protein